MAVNGHKVAGRIPEFSFGPGRLTARELLPSDDRRVARSLVSGALVETGEVLLDHRILGSEFLGPAECRLGLVVALHAREDRATITYVPRASVESAA